MKHRFLAFLVLLVGCSPMPGISDLSQPSSPIPLTSETISSSPLPFSTTPFPSPTDSQTPTLAPSKTPTSASTQALTSTPTATLPAWSYVFPVQPISGVDFAEGVASHGYPATDIFAPQGSRVVAVTNGFIDFVSKEDQWEPIMDDPALRGGISVAIIGDDGVRYYGSHLLSIQPGITPGMRVIKGQVLGLVGNSGDARSTLPHLHFGISQPTQPDDWRTRRGELDPFSFLLAWRDGLNITPDLAEITKERSNDTTSLFTYVFPVQPVKNVNFNEGGHGYPATDIFSPLGSQFVAVTAGIVDNVSYQDRWDPASSGSGLSGGLWISILGDDGVRYYGSHLSAIAAGIQLGKRVRAGDLLGLVGNSGDARGTLTHVHFEISRPTSASDWMSRASLIDPFPFLLAWKSGDNVTPPIIAP
jgi:peptidoglycan LD-endopeptidase LytH